MDHRMFKTKTEVLVGAGYQVLTWDIRGHGLSKPLGEVPMIVRDMVEDFRSLLDHAGINGPVHVGGQSLGGYVAQEFYFRYPERVLSMIIIIGSTCITAPTTRTER